MTANFNASDFTCKCGKCDGGKVNPHFLNTLQNLRDACGFPFKIDSGFRCPEHNKAVGGEPDSLHLKGRAADIAIGGGWQRYKLLQTALQSGSIGGLGVAKTYIHLDDRGPGDDVPTRVIWTYYK